MANEQKTLKEKIEREQERLDVFYKKREELNKKIRKSETALANYRLMENNQRLEVMDDMAGNLGLSVEDIISALQKGELSELQRKAEAARLKQDGKDAEREDGEGEGNA